MAKTKKLLSVFLALLMMLTVFPTSIIASAANAATVTVESVNAVPGSNVEVNINVKNNPGILAANFTVTYDKGLTLIDSKSGDAFSALSMTKPENYNSPCKFGWDALEIADEDIKDGTILTLTFSVDKNVSANSKLNVKLSYQNGNIIDSDLNDIPVTINNGSVTIIDYIPGDINGDGTIDLKDVTLVRRLVTGYGVTANKLAADVNGDGEITMKDVVLIRRYVVDAEGYGVTLVPGGSNVHTHTMTATAAKAATCTENGNIAYWYCSSCEKYFTDKDGNNVVSQADTVIKAKGHTVAMTGDGVNDVIALRQADCSITLPEASDVAKQVSQIVLLNSDFSVLKDVLMEGRRVVNNITNVATIFFIKTLYSVMLSILNIITCTAFPFMPIQITLVDLAIEGYTSFFISFEPNGKQIKEKFLKSVLKNSFPYSVVIIINIICLYFLAPSMGIAEAKMTTLMYYMIGFTSILAVVRVCRPFNKMRVFLCTTTAIGFFVATILFRNLLHLSKLGIQELTVFLIMAILSTILILIKNYLMKVKY